MAGIYLHIPFCKQACHYCNFHFATSLRYKNELLAALLKETECQKDYLDGKEIKTIYFGGGTPSLLKIADLRLQIGELNRHFNISTDAEITIEVNPDDVTEENLGSWKDAGFNRLSVGVQSFFDEDLSWMNRAHNAGQAMTSLQLATRHFENISVDLIYGTPHLTNERWKRNVDTVLSFGIPHLSCYALTVEEKTPLARLIRQRQSPDIDPEKQSEQFTLLMQWLDDAGYEHYEISNFAKAGHRSRHNSSYWSGESYLGLGPSSHSFNQTSRQWNISNNARYIEAINQGKIPCETEVLTSQQKINEYIMTSLRTLEGMDLERLEEKIRERVNEMSAKYLEQGLMKKDNNSLVLTREGKLFADGIASRLFV